MKIGLIGAGHIGGTLAGKLARAGHTIGIGNAHGPQSLAALCRDIGTNATAMTVDDVASFGEIVIVSVPFGRFREVPARDLAGKIVIDTCNYYPERDGHFPDLDSGRTSSSEMIAANLPGARIVKAFNNVRWDHLRDEGRPAGDRDRLAVGIAGDDEQAKAVVIGLIEELGFDAVDTGSLAFGGRRLQPGSSVYNAHLTAREMKERLAA